jgi:hypothetical protein
LNRFGKDCSHCSHFRDHCCSLRSGGFRKSVRCRVFAAEKSVRTIDSTTVSGAALMHYWRHEMKRRMMRRSLLLENSFWYVLFVLL